MNFPNVAWRTIIQQLVSEEFAARHAEILKINEHFLEKCE